MGATLQVSLRLDAFPRPRYKCVYAVRPVGGGGGRHFNRSGRSIGWKQDKNQPSLASRRTWVLAAGLINAGTHTSLGMALKLRSLLSASSSQLICWKSHLLLSLYSRHSRISGWGKQCALSAAGTQLLDIQGMLPDCWHSSITSSWPASSGLVLLSVGGKATVGSSHNTQSCAAPCRHPARARLQDAQAWPSSIRSRMSSRPASPDLVLLGVRAKATVDGDSFCAKLGCMTLLQLGCTVSSCWQGSFARRSSQSGPDQKLHEQLTRLFRPAAACHDAASLGL